MNAAFRPIPVFEPEVIAAGAARHRGDDGKIATTSLGEVAWRGVRISSRYAKAREMENVLQMLRAVPENLLEPVLSVWCDSKSSDYRVEVKPCTPFQARMLAGALAAASEGHNTITLHTLGEVLVELGPNEGGCR
jgi:hypothetical protein